MGNCILIGFSTGGGSGGFEEWAVANLISTSDNIPRKPLSMSFADWARVNFATKTDGTIPEPSSKTKSALIAWAKENFLTTTTS